MAMGVPTDGASSIVVCGSNAADVDDVPLQNQASKCPHNPAARGAPGGCRTLVRTLSHCIQPVAQAGVRRPAPCPA